MGFGDAVRKGADGELYLHHTSASGMDKIQQCELAWKAHYVGKVKSTTDMSAADDGTALHALLDKAIKESVLFEEFDMTQIYEMRPEIVHRAQERVDKYNWEAQFSDHVISDSEMDVIIDLNDVAKERGYTPKRKLPLLVMKIDVLSSTPDLFWANDWKSARVKKGRTIQADVNALGITMSMDTQFVGFRMLYPNISGEIRGAGDTEEFIYSRSEALETADRMFYLTERMMGIIDGDIEPKYNTSMKCLWCSNGLNCDVITSTGKTMKEIVQKFDVATAMLKQSKDIMSAFAKEEGDFEIDGRKFGLSSSEYWKFKGEKSVAEILYEHNPELLFEKLKPISVDEDVKAFLESIGYEDLVKNQGRQVFGEKKPPKKPAAKKAKKKAEPKEDQAA